MKPCRLLFCLGALLGVGASAFSLGLQSGTTTVYVGQHYEIREHDAPSKYVFNGDTRVARITGSLSSSSRIQRFRLHTGWNLMSLAVSATNALYQITNGHPGSFVSQSILAWDLASRGWVALLPGQTLPAEGILWLKVATNASLTLIGNYREPTPRQVDAAGSFLPAAGLQVWDIRSALSRVSFVTAWAYDNSAATWLVGLAAPLQAQSDLPTVLAPGTAAFVRSAAPAQLAVSDPGSRITYYHEDRLGSSSAITDASANLVDEAAYFPFGGTREAAPSRRTAEPYGFSQKERDRESGLQYFGKRFYSSALGKWLSTDPKEEAGGGLNLYAYVNQNPLKYLDPDGAEISLGEASKDPKTGITTQPIVLDAVLMDVPGAHPDQQLSQHQLEQYAKDLTEDIQNRYKAYDPETKTQYKAVVHLKLLGVSEKPGPNDHVFMIVGGYKMSGAGETRHRDLEDKSRDRGMVMKIQVHTLLDARPDRLHPDNKYKSPESIGAHEFGHAAGLDDLETDTKNLMSHGRENNSQEITLKQMKAIVNQFQTGHLNKHLD
jgi:RHS repeat-associated protein